jgi:hypothetical protein
MHNFLSQAASQPGGNATEDKDAATRADVTESEENRRF